jgi:hypothetical protein
MVRRGQEHLGRWQHRSPPKQRGGVWSLGHMAAPEPSLSRDAGSGAVVPHCSAWVHALPFDLS